MQTPFSLCIMKGYGKMDLVKQNVLFFTRTMYLGGTENVVLQLCEIFKPLVNKIVVCSCGGVNTGKLSKMGIIHYEIPDIEKKSVGVFLNTVKMLKHIVEKESITVIHTHHRMAAFYVALLKLYRECKFINTCHNTFSNKRLLTKFAYRHANLVTCGESVKKNLVNYFGIDEKRVTVIRNAVKSFHEQVILDPTIKKLHDDGYFVVGNIGRLSEQKGMEYYIRAIPEVLKKCPNVRFLIIGSGEDEEKLKKLSEELHLEKYLIFMGYMKDIQNVMSQLDLVVLSSLWEGLPLTPVEAFSVGKTIVASKVDGTAEIVEDGRNGLLTDAKSYEQITQAVVKLCRNDDERKMLEKNALVTFEKKFSFGMFEKSYVEYYQKMDEYCG